MPNNYAEYYKTKLEGALLFQDFVVDLFYQDLGIPIVQYASKVYQNKVGETRCGIEIKHDEKFNKTCNLWIEISEKASQREGEYVKSGIYRNDNAWLYIIGDYDTIFIFSKKQLQDIHRNKKYRVIENNTHTSTGFFLPERDAIALSLFILTPKAKQKVSKITQDLSEASKILHAMLTKPKNSNQLVLFQGNGT